MDWAFLRPQEPVKFTEGTGKVMNTVPPSDFSYFEMINDLVQKEPVGALDPEIMGSLAAIGIVKGKPFNPDARMKKILTDAAAIGTAAARTLNWRWRPIRGRLLLSRLHLVQPALRSAATTWKRRRHRSAPTAVITLISAHGRAHAERADGHFLLPPFITPAMIMRLTDIGSQYLGAFVDSKGEYFDGSKTYK